MTNIFEQQQATDPRDDEAIPRSNKVRRRLTAAELRAGRERLSALSDDAFETLREAIRYAEYPTAIQAAKIVLDRTGFGSEQTININDNRLEDVPTEKLLERGFQLLGDNPAAIAAMKRLLASRPNSDDRNGSEAKSDMVH